MLLTTIVCVILDLLMLGALVWGGRVLYRRLKKKKQLRLKATEHIALKDRRIFADRERLFTDKASQEKPSYVEALGIAPLPPKRNQPLPRESHLDYGVIEPWEVSVDIENQRIQREGQKILEQDLQRMFNPF